MKSKGRYLKISLVMFQIIKIISTLLGLAPCSIKISNQSAQKIGLTFAFAYSQVACAYNILLIMLCIVVSMIAVPKLNDLPFPNNSNIAKTITITLALMGNILVIVITIIYSIRQRKIIKIGNRLYEFDEKYEDKLIGKRGNILGKFQKFTTIILMLFIWIGLVTTTITSGEHVYLITSGLRSISCSWLLVQYSLVINILKDRFEWLNNALGAIAKCSMIFKDDSMFRGSVSNDRLIVKNLIIIKRARNEIYKISRQVSSFYSFPVLLVIGFSCCCCVNSLHYYIMIVIHAATDYHGLNGISSIFWAIAVLYPIMVLSASVNTFHLEAHRTADIVYDIMETYAPNKDIESELNIFAVELLHKSVSFNACGIFSLDCTLLHSICGMIVTYLLILLQFKPADG